MTSASPLMDVKEVAGVLEMTSTRVRQLIALGELPAVRIGGRIRVPREAFDDWIAEKNRLALAGLK